MARKNLNKKAHFIAEEPIRLILWLLILLAVSAAVYLIFKKIV